MSLESVTEEWMQGLTKVGGLYSMAALARAGLLDAYYTNILALYDVTQGGLMYTGAAAGGLALTAGLPIITAVGAWVALGSGYYQAREEAKKEETMSGFSQGFVMAISGWRWSHVVPLFRRPLLRINKFDETMDVIRVNSYHEGLKRGFLTGTVLSEETRKAYRRKIKEAGNVHGPSEWSRNDDEKRNQQISYVIAMAGAARRYGIIKEE
jgi:hypothetical protein